MTTQAISPSIHVGTYPGTRLVNYDLRISPQYLTNVITFKGLNEGFVTIRARLIDNNNFEQVINGEIDLSDSKTIRIDGYPIEELRFIMSQTIAFTVEVRQYTFRPVQ